MEQYKMYLDGSGFGWKRVAVDLQTVIRAAVNGVLLVYMHVSNEDHDLLCRVLGSGGYDVPEWKTVELIVAPSEVREITSREYVATSFLDGTVGENGHETGVSIIKIPSNWAPNVEIPRDIANTLDTETQTFFSVFHDLAGETEPDRDFVISRVGLYVYVTDVETVFPDHAKQYLEDKPYIGRDEIMDVFSDFGRKVKSWTTILDFEKKGLNVIREAKSPILMRSEVLRFLDRKP